MVVVRIRVKICKEFSVLKRVSTERKLAITIIKDVYICNKTIREMLNTELRVVLLERRELNEFREGYMTVSKVLVISIFKLGNGYALYNIYKLHL